MLKKPPIMFRGLFIPFLCIVLFSMGCSDGVDVNSNKERIINYETSTLIFANLEFEDTEEEKKLALESPFFTLTKLKRKRKFTVYKFSGDSIHNAETIIRIGEMIKGIKIGRDTVNAIQVTFDDQTPIEYFVKTHKLLMKEKPQFVANTLEEGVFGWYMDKTL